ncbi:MAG: helix-turn-helix domain-containing protein [Anaerolineales bacterium]
MPNLSDILYELQLDDEPAPNKFTTAVGNLVRQAREEAALSQTELARKTFRRRATISNIETGKSEATLITLVRIADSLNKPISYFLPLFIYGNLESEELSREAEELLIHFDRISAKTLRGLAIKQIRAIAEADAKRHTSVKP